MFTVGLVQEPSPSEGEVKPMTNMGGNLHEAVHEVT